MIDKDGVMRALVQRVKTAAVDVRSADGTVERTADIGAGLCALVGVTHTDGEPQAAALAQKLWALRILDDADGVMNRSLSDLSSAGEDAQILVVSQFTLYGDTRKGRRPGWSAAARPEHAEPLIDRVVDTLIELGAATSTGRFRTHMEVSLVNDGPVSLMIDVD